MHSPSLSTTPIATRVDAEAPPGRASAADESSRPASDADRKSRAANGGSDHPRRRATDLDAPRDDAAPAYVLLVEPDALQREILVAGLALYDPRLHPLAVAHAQAALRVLETSDVDLVITELAFPETADGADYIDRLRLLAPRVPILALTEARATVVTLRARVDAMLRKPAEMDDLMRTTQALLKRRRESVVRGLALASFLQILQLERKSCTITASVRGRQGRIALRLGRVVAAEAEGVSGKEAVFLLLTWIAPVLSVIEQCDVQPTMDTGVQELLLEHYVNEDHQRRS